MLELAALQQLAILKARVALELLTIIVSDGSGAIWANEQKARLDSWRQQLEAPTVSAIITDRFMHRDTPTGRAAQQLLDALVTNLVSCKYLIGHSGPDNDCSP